jgi:cephalosporin-C deacetylase
VAIFDLPLDELQRYTPDLPEPEDFNEFWTSTLEEAREHELDVHLEPVETAQQPFASMTRSTVRRSS